MKRKILIASFLKPVNDIRSYEKIAKSLAKNNAHQIYCIGYPTNIAVSDKNIELIPLSSFNKNGLGRILARWKVFKSYIKVKPELIIVNSLDLLLFTCLYKIIFGGQIIYDIRENYFKNLWHQHNYIWGLKHLLALSVRAKERITAPLFNYFLLAEKVYSTQLIFVRKKFIVLENKTLKPLITKSTVVNYKSPTFIISGTIAVEYGIYEGITFFKSILKTCQNSHLVIIGKCANKSLLNELNLLSNNSANINVIISKNPIAHTHIEQEILRSDFGLFPYMPNESTKGKYPTKTFEFLGYSVPFIIQNNTEWKDFLAKHSAGFAFDFANQTNEKINKLWEHIKSNPIDIKNIDPSIYWKSEEEKLLKIINTCLK